MRWMSLCVRHPSGRPVGAGGRLRSMPGVDPSVNAGFAAGRRHLGSLRARTPAGPAHHSATAGPARVHAPHLGLHRGHGRR